MTAKSKNSPQNDKMNALNKTFCQHNSSIGSWHRKCKGGYSTKKLTKKNN